MRRFLVCSCAFCGSAVLPGGTRLREPNCHQGTSHCHVHGELSSAEDWQGRRNNLQPSFIGGRHGDVQVAQQDVCADSGAGFASDLRDRALDGFSSELGAPRAHASCIAVPEFIEFRTAAFAFGWC